MEKNRVYIFFTYNINTVGGTQMYTAGKADYLHKRGWQVFVFFNGSREGKAVIPSLTQYLRVGGGLSFLYTPPYKFRKHEQEFCLREMFSRLGLINGTEYEIIIESHSDELSYWGELLAARIGARHFIICCNEIYRSVPNIVKTYVDNLEFFHFKWQRNELVGTNKSLQRLFNGYKNVTKPLVEMPPTVREMDAIQDVPFPVEKIIRADWNICHVGRAEKIYVPYVIEGVGALARRHLDKKIHFLMVGNADSRINLLQDTFRDLPNIAVTLLGDLVPIPRILFTKVDVVCAISQSARFTANEDILTIVGNSSEPARTPGVLGYDTELQTCVEGTFSYVEALENVLVKRLYDGKKYTLPKLKPLKECYDNFWTIVRNASPVKEYYVKRLTEERIRNWTAIFPFGSIARGSRIILFGENEIAQDYRKQIDSQNECLKEFGRDYVKLLTPRPYCQVIATVDIHPEEFDDTVVGVERLKKRDYDAIIICLPPAQVPVAVKKICAVVPDMAEFIVYIFQVLYI